MPGMPWQERPAGALAVWRHRGNPLIGWNPTGSCARVFNSAVVPFGGAYAGVFRADHRNGRAHLHAGFSDDGLSWRIEDGEIGWKDEEGRDFQPGYAYDPRVARIEGRHYVTWCCDFSGAALALGVTDDFRSFTRLENPSCPYNRNGVLFPRKVGGMYLLLSRPSDSAHTPFGDIFLSESPDLVHWGRHRKVMSRGTSGWWQGTKIGAGPVPIETTEGWLLFYHGVSGTCNGFVYSFGAALLDLDRPSRVIYRTRDYLLTPQEPYETTGFVPNVAFPCATLHDASTGRIAIYYGAADTCVALAYCRVDEVLQAMRGASELAAGDAEEYSG
ncbi:MAG: glycoside hydrolase family 130 protein [Spirochaetaceae bacterium]|nr:glycoside hydrolase family 130 protein [Spirochaetaceae bacterium]